MRWGAAHMHMRTPQPRAYINHKFKIYNIGEIESDVSKFELLVLPCVLVFLGHVA